MYRLVIVEDEENIRDCLLNLFPWEDIGIEVVKVFSNGRDALDYLRANTVEFLLSDIRLPRLDGIELARQLTLHQKDINIVFLTAHRSFEYAQLAVKYGVKDFLLKPVKYNELMMTFLRLKESMQELQTRSGVITEQDESSSPYYNQIIENVKKYIQAHLSSVTLEDAALSVSLSSGYLSRLFREKTGKTFSEYVTRQRMEKAASLLRDSSIKAYEAALMVGYDNPKNFTRAFKQYYQVTPREFRERGM